MPLIARQFERPDAMGGEWWASRIRWTDRKLMPSAFARIRPVQWVAASGGGPSARSTTCCTASGGSGGLPGLRVLSRASPATPSAMNHACHRHTTGFDLPDRCMISAVPQPSAVARRFWPAKYASAGAAIGDNRLKLTAISRADGHHYSCSHAESLNAFERFGNRSNESDH
jgi:hypothetical protein